MGWKLQAEIIMVWLKLIQTMKVNNAHSFMLSVLQGLCIAESPSSCHRGSRKNAKHDLLPTNFENWRRGKHSNWIVSLLQGLGEGPRWHLKEGFRSWSYEVTNGIFYPQDLPCVHTYCTQMWNIVSDYPYPYIPRSLFYTALLSGWGTKQRDNPIGNYLIIIIATIGYLRFRRKLCKIWYITTQ